MATTLTGLPESLKPLRERVSSLPPQLRREFLQALTPRTTRYIPHVPTPAQAAYLILPHREAFFGGAVGGGKSDALLMGALQDVEVPGYAAILFRRTFQDLSLPGALIPRSHEWLSGTDASWDGIGHQWRFPSGAYLQFGYLQHAGDEHRYRSAEFQYEGFDEATQFPNVRQVTYLYSRMRRPSSGPVSKIALRARLASNPGGVGHEWVYTRFINPKTRHPGSAFLPSWLHDNPYLDAVDYLATLEDVLDDVTLAQLRDGDWTVRPLGGRFDRRWLRLDHLHGSLPKEAAGWRWVRAWDLAATEAKEGEDPDWTVGTLMGLDDENEPWIADVRRFREDPGTTEDIIKATIADDRLRYENLTSIMEQEPGASGKTVIAHFEKVLWGVPFSGWPISGKKEVRAIPLSTAWRRGAVNVVVSGWTEDYFDEHEAFPTGAHDDQVDASSAGYNYLVEGAFEPGGQTIVRPQGSTERLASAYHARRGITARRA